jgi:hypothetical protein
MVGGVHTGSTRHVGHFWPIVPALGDCEEGEFGGMKIGRGNRSTRRKPAPTPLGPPQILLDQNRARTLAAAVGSQLLTAWAMTRSQNFDLLKSWKSNYKYSSKRCVFLLVKNGNNLSKPVVQFMNVVLQILQFFKMQTMTWTSFETYG